MLHNAIRKGKHEACPGMQLKACDRFFLTLARQLLTMRRTMPSGRTPPRAADAFFPRGGATDCRGRYSLAVARFCGLGAAWPIEISGGFRMVWAKGQSGRERVTGQRIGRTGQAVTTGSLSQNAEQTALIEDEIESLQGGRE